MGKLPLSVYLQRAATAYQEFVRPSVNNMYDVFPGMVRVLNWGMMILSVPLFGMLLYSLRKSPVNLAILVVLFPLIPLAVNFIFVMAGREFCNSLMVYAKTMAFVFFAWILERTRGVLHQKAAGLMRLCCTSFGLSTRGRITGSPGTATCSASISLPGAKP